MILTGMLDVAALEQSLDQLVRRHEILRTVFTVFDGAPRQMAHPEMKVPIDVADLSVLPPDEREAEALRLAAAQARRPFDLSRGPLLRVNLFKLDRNKQILLYTVHHIIADGPSCRILNEEVAALYRAALSRAVAPLPDLPIQFADFAVWQRAQLSEDVIERQRAFWRRELAGAPDAFMWRPARQQAECAPAALREFALPPTLCEELKMVCRRERVTLFTLLLSAFFLLLRHHTEREDIVVGVDVSKRDHPETQGLIGFFVDQLPVRADLSGDPRFNELLQRVRRAFFNAYAHRDLPFDMVVKTVNPERSADHSPLFQVKIALQSGGADRLSLPGVACRPFEIGNGQAQLDLIVNMTEAVDALAGVWEYNAALFDDSSIAELIAGFEAVLQVAGVDLEIKVSEVRQRLALLEKERKVAEAERLRELSRNRFRKAKRRAPAGTQ
jgi:hypothetical protein